VTSSLASAIRLPSSVELEALEAQLDPTLVDDIAPTRAPALLRALADADVVLVWGEGASASMLPPGARVIRLEAYAQPYLAQADVFIPISIQTERSGHYTNFEGVVSPFAALFTARPTVAHAETVFAALAEAVQAATPMAGARA
jgi:NADH dehydrogenase/NADH:ubiquinone oxidoreductase subunit G